MFVSSLVVLLLLKVCIGEIKLGVVKFVYLVVLVLERSPAKTPVSPRSSPTGDVSARNVPAAKSEEKRMFSQTLSGETFYCPAYYK